MPLRDLFRLPLSESRHWEGFCSAWVNTMVHQVNGPYLPPKYRATPEVRLGAWKKSDRILKPYVYEMRVHYESGQLISVAALVSPANKDDAVARRLFASKCAAYLSERLPLVIIDAVTNSDGNSCDDVLRSLKCELQDAPLHEACAVTLRPRPMNGKWMLDVWREALNVGSVLPTLPLWVNGDTAVPLDLEKSFEETCRVLRIE
jgi:hypothetical protein